MIDQIPQDLALRGQRGNRGVPTATGAIMTDHSLVIGVDS